MCLISEIMSDLLERRFTFQTSAKDDAATMPELCRDLLSSYGEVSGIRLARRILDKYERMNSDEKYAFFMYLAKDLDIEPMAAHAALVLYAQGRGKTEYATLMKTVEPARQELARRLNQVPGATEKIVNMRQDLLKCAKTAPDIARVDLDFQHLLSSWFNRGFLVLRPINWESPANVLEKIIAYEAVHSIASWDELRLRIEPADRRCFGYFHPSMPHEPLIFVEVALTQGIAGSVDAILAEDRVQVQPESFDTAVFYSISNCQPGLQGVSFGNSLIKQVVDDLSAEFPQLMSFVTLSPIPGLSKWAQDMSINLEEDGRALAAHYLLDQKRDDGLPRDSVARFHLKNGAQVHAIHANADLSEKGHHQSGGLMVNYLYERQKITKNHEKFLERQIIAASEEMCALAQNGIVIRQSRTNP